MTVPIVDYAYHAKLLEVHDGDTYKMRFDLGFGITSTHWLRLRGAWSPELSEPGGAEAAAWVSLRLITAHQIIVRTQKTRTGTDVRSFVRYIADIWVDSESLADQLVAKGHATRTENR